MSTKNVFAALCNAKYEKVCDRYSISLSGELLTFSVDDLILHSKNIQTLFCDKTFRYNIHLKYFKMESI